MSFWVRKGGYGSVFVDELNWSPINDACFWNGASAKPKEEKFLFAAPYLDIASVDKIRIHAQMQNASTHPQHVPFLISWNDCSHGFTSFDGLSVILSLPWWQRSPIFVCSVFGWVIHGELFLVWKTESIWNGLIVLFECLQIWGTTFRVKGKTWDAG